MRRYQVYLNPHSVMILDDFEKSTGIGRSQLIRESIDCLSQNLAKVLALGRPKETHRSLHLDRLVGLIKLKHKKETNFASRSDRDYLDD